MVAHLNYTDTFFSSINCQQSLSCRNDTVPPVRSVQNLGICVDADRESQCARTCWKRPQGVLLLQCCAISWAFDDLSLWQYCSPWWFALVLSQLDYGSTLLAGLPKQLLDRLQSVQNAAARLVFAAHHNDHITPLLHSLHWLRVAERITFRLAVLTYCASMVQRQSTWHLCCSAFPTYILASDFALLRLLAWWCHGQFAPPLVNGLSSQQLHPRRMLCLILCVLPHYCYSSEVDSRQNYSRVHTSNLTEFVSASVTQHFCSVILKSLDLRHVNVDSNTN